jgi:predicted DNA-binding transcriptional regulator AlpA
MSAGRAARFLGVSRESLRRWINQGDGPPRVRKGKRYYYVREVLKEWLKSNAPPASDSPRPAKEAKPPVSAGSLGRVYNGASVSLSPRRG